jgi:hypothetical protein
LNRYAEIRQVFTLLECTTRQKEVLKRCGNLPDRLGGRNAASGIRDYVYGLMLVAVIAQLEHDVTRIQNVPGLQRAPGLAYRLRILRDHFQVGMDSFDAVDRIRDARNVFVHDGMISANAGCTKVEMPGHIVTFLQQCKHPDYP